MKVVDSVAIDILAPDGAANVVEINPNPGSEE
jgi:D-alanine-D-alanine ligase-like ATP-grasp enzyme